MVTPKATDRTITNCLADLRRAHGWSQLDLAVALHLHPQVISRWERGERTPSLYWALRIAALFECPLEQIFSLPNHSQ